MTEKDDIVVIRASLRANLLLGMALGGGIPLIIFIAIGLTNKSFDKGILTVTILLCLWFVIVQLWVSCHCIILSTDALKYRTLLKGWATINRHDIQSGFFKVKRRMDGIPPYSLTLKHKKNNEKIIINVRMFSFTNMQTVRVWLGEKSIGELKRSLFKKTT